MCPSLWCLPSARSMREWARLRGCLCPAQFLCSLALLCMFLSQHTRTSGNLKSASLRFNKAKVLWRFYFSYMQGRFSASHALLADDWPSGLLAVANDLCRKAYRTKCLCFRVSGIVIYSSDMILNNMIWKIRIWRKIVEALKRHLTLHN